jgi:hypothetical protein
MNFNTPTLTARTASALPVAVRDVVPVASIVITVVLLEPPNRCGIDVT